MLAGETEQQAAVNVATEAKEYAHRDAVAVKDSLDAATHPEDLELEALESMELERAEAEEATALEGVSQKITEKHGERILKETDITRRRALEMGAKLEAQGETKKVKAGYAERKKGISAGYTLRRQAAKQQRKQARQAQTALGKEKLIAERQARTAGELKALTTMLPAEVKGKIGGEVELHRLRTPQAMEEYLSKRMEQIGEALEEHLKDQLTERIKTMVARYRPKKIGGVYKSRIGDAQEVVTRLKRIIKLSNDETVNEMNRNMTEFVYPGDRPGAGGRADRREPAPRNVRRHGGHGRRASQPRLRRVGLHHQGGTGLVGREGRGET